MSQSREGQVFSAEMAGHETWLKEKKKMLLFLILEGFCSTQ